MPYCATFPLIYNKVKNCHNVLLVNDLFHFDCMPSNNDYFIVLVNLYFLDCHCPSDGHMYHGHCFFISPDSYTHSGAQVGNKKISQFKLRHI